jgi:aminoglycoside 3-N-acetyltransferase
MNEEGITRDQIVSDLRSFGIQEGDHVGASLSFKSIGRVHSGPEGFIDALIEAVGSGGTIMMPTYTSFYPLPDVRSGKIDYIFDHRTTKATTGLIPEMLRNRDASIRSMHPTNSITAIGEAAEYLTEGHDEEATAYLPYSRLAGIDGKILCMGVGDNLIAVRHEAQYLAGLLNVIPFKLGVNYRDGDGSIKTFIRRDRGGCMKRLPEFVPKLMEMGIIKEGRVGKARSLLMPAKEGLEAMTAMLKEDPTLNLCDEISCLWCRELERRMDLYDRIENPAYFQRYPPLRIALAWINRRRLEG